MIALAIGMTTTREIKDRIKNNNYIVAHLGSMVYVDPVVIYDTLKDALKVR